MRDQADAGSDAPEDAGRENPWDEPEVPRLGDLGGHQMPADPTAEELTGAKAEQYALWQQRMHDKRARTRAMLDGPTDPSTSRTHWSTDALFAESRLVEEKESVSRPNPWRTRQLLSTLDLTEGASLDEVSLAYRRLAKTHHPDRYVGASEEVRDFHAKKMLDINAAYSSLKALLATGS